MNPLRTIIGSVCLTLATAAANSQTADQLVLQGRNLIVMSNFAAANIKLTAALSQQPQHEAAHVLRALVRVALIPVEPAGSNFLTHLGLPREGRSLLDWTARLPADTNHALLVANHLNAAELVAFARTNVLPALQASAADLAAVTNESFVLSLSKAETHLEAVLIDYGDLQVVRALLAACQYFTYLISAHNASAQLDGVRELYEQGMLSIERILADHPALLTFANTNDLLLARQAFEDTVAHYLTGSERIRGRVGERPPRLFNVDWSDLEEEAHFRCTLLDLRDSLTHPVVLCEATNLTVLLASQFSGRNSLRTFLPRFAGNSILADSLPDSTFGGLIQGLSIPFIDHILAKRLPVVTWFSDFVWVPPARQIATFHTLTGQCYAIEFSTNLVDWLELTSFQAFNSAYIYTNTAPPSALGFYRLHDLKEFVTYEGVVINACSAQPVPGATVQESLSGAIGLSDSSGHFKVQTRYYPQFQETILSAFAAGYHASELQLFYASDFRNLRLTMLSAAQVPPLNDQFANRTPLSGFPVSAAGNTCGATRESGEPFHTSWQPGIKSIWWSWTAPASGTVTIYSTHDNDPYSYYPKIVAVYTGSTLSLLNQVTFAYEEEDLSFNAVAGTTYQIVVATSDDYPDSGGSVQIFIEPASPFRELAVASPLPESVFEGPTNIWLDVTLNGGAPFSYVHYSVSGSGRYLSGNLTGPTYSTVLTNVPPDDYGVYFGASFGQSDFLSTNFSFRVRHANDDFARRQTIPSIQTFIFGSTRGAGHEPSEPAHGGIAAERSAWWSWSPQFSGPVDISAYSDHAEERTTNVLAIYTGGVLSALTPVAGSTSLVTPNVSQVAFIASAGTAYQIALDTHGLRGDNFVLTIERGTPPTVQIIAPVGDARLNAATLNIAANASDADGVVARVEFCANGRLLGAATNSPYTLTWTNLPFGRTTLQAVAVDDAGLRGYSSLVEVRRIPSNDDLAQATPLAGTNLAITGSNQDATLEPGEDLWSDLGYLGGASVWWRWTAPFDGMAAVSARFLVNYWNPVLLGIYTGTSVSTLTPYATAVSDFGETQATFLAQSNTSYLLVVDGTYGNQGLIELGLNLQPIIALERAVDYPSAIWTTSGDALWLGEGQETHDNVDAAQSGSIGDSEQSVLQTTVIGPGTLSFWWKVSSEPGYDFLSFHVGAARQAQISGQAGWQRLTFSISSGSQILRWIYSKDSSVSSGLDAGWVDEVSFSAASPASPSNEGAVNLDKQ